MIDEAIAAYRREGYDVPEEDCHCCKSKPKCCESCDSSDKPWHSRPACVFCAMMGFIVNPSSFYVPPMFPMAFTWLLKFRFFAGVFDILFYIFNVSHGVDWWQPSWLLKFLMAIYSLGYVMWSVGILRKKWPLARYGVLLDPPWPAHRLWEVWSTTCINAFQMTEDNSMWKHLRRAYDVKQLDATQTDPTSLATM